jgi:signal transduction histidine kinase
LLLCALCLPAPAASSLDSLHKKLETAPDGPGKIALLLQLSRASEGEASQGYASRALELAQQLGDQAGIAEAEMQLGKFFYFSQDFARSLENCSKSLALSRSLHNDSLSAIACRYIGYNYFSNDPQLAMDYYRKSVEYSKLCGNRLLESYALSAIGNLFESLNDGSSALENYLKSLEIRRTLGSPDEVVSSLIETARGYNRLGKFDRSMDLVFEARQVAETKGSDQHNLVYIYQMIGYDYADRRKDYKTALGFFTRSYNLAMSRETPDRNDINSIKPVAEMYEKLGDHLHAAEYYRQYVELLQKDALKLDKQFFSLRDSLRNESNRKALSEKDAEILRQQSEIRQRENTRNLLAAGLALLALCAFFIYRGYQRNRRMNVTLERKVEEKTKALSQANDQLRISEEKLVVANKELESFVYKAAHDLKGPLVSAKGLLELIRQEEDIAQSRQYMEMLKGLLEKEESILAALHEISLVRQGAMTKKAIDLPAAIQKVIAEFNGHPAFGRVRFTSTGTLAREFRSDEILLNTVLRNVIENAIKYSRPGIANAYVKIHLFEEGAYHVVQITDNGIGIPEEFLDKVFDVFFRATDEVSGTGLGLYIVRNAMAKLGGRARIVKNPDEQGARLELYFPV